MDTPIWNCSPLIPASGYAADIGGNNQAIGVALKSALTGSLTVTGVANLDGSAASWVIAPGATGWQTPPGNSQGLCQALTFVLSNVAADAGKALLIWKAR